MSTPRVLLVTERTVSAPERTGYLAALRDTKARCADAGVQFWVFTHEQDDTRFLEFAETKDGARLASLGLDTPPAERWHALEIV